MGYPRRGHPTDPGQVRDILTSQPGLVLHSTPGLRKNVEKRLVAQVERVAVLRIWMTMKMKTMRTGTNYLEHEKEKYV